MHDETNLALVARGEEGYVRYRITVYKTEGNPVCHVNYSAFLDRFFFFSSRYFSSLGISSVSAVSSLSLLSFT